MITHHVVYQFVQDSPEGTVGGFGSTNFAGPMSTKEQIMGAADLIKNLINAKAVVIINWIPLPDEPPPRGRCPGPCPGRTSR